MPPKVKILNRLLPLVAIGTVADCQSILQPTNRLLVKAGISLMQSGKHGLAGLSELSLQIGLGQKINQGYQLNSQDLAFSFSPILNSSGRLSHAKLSIASLVETENLPNIAAELIATNNQRKATVKEIIAEIEHAAKLQFEEGKTLIWLVGDWSKGIVGLLASKLFESYQLPVAVVSQSEDDFTGSMRGPEWVNFPLALKQVPELLIKGGGHPQAAGFSTTKLHLEKLHQKLEAITIAQRQEYLASLPQAGKATNGNSELETLLTRKDVLEIELTDLDSGFLQEIFTLDPFGQDFPMPKLLLKIDDARALKPRFMGVDKKHVKLELNGLNLTIFNLNEDLLNFFSDMDDTSQASRTCRILAKISQNTWNNQTKLELIGDKVLVGG